MIDLSGLNERQRKIAETLDEPLFVEAGAGSGKTFTLTQRVAWALSPGSGEGGAAFLDSLDQVLVITFTEAAAREIKERVRTTLRRAHMDEAALAVDDAWISTIHGMCTRILRRHALDLGLDPAFRPVMGLEADALYEAALDAAMGEARASEEFRPLVEEHGIGGPKVGSSGYTGLMGLVDELYQKGCSLVGGLDALLPAAGDKDGVARAMGELLMRVEELGAQKLGSASANKVAAALEALRGFDKLASGERTADAADAALAQIVLPNRSSKIPEIGAAKDALDLAKAEVAFSRVAHLAPVLLALTRRFAERYEGLKRDKSVLDMDDLVRLALRAVRENDDVRRAYAGHFRLVMVDEFQDTDEMQLELIELLAGPGARHLCTVGDAQQSIYRFRGADVGVFRGRGAGVAEAGRVRLDTNYRSHADILALVDRICGGGDAAPGVMDGFMHLDDNPTREDAYKARELPRIDLEVTRVSGHRGEVGDAGAAVAASQVADALLSYKEAGERPGDMALLLGVTTHADLYIDAIRAREMECVVSGGSTFTKTDEVKVMKALLHTLANPSDTQSGLFPLLASEMFGLDANDFCALGTRAQDKLDAPTKRGIDRGLASMELYGDVVASERLQRAHQVISRALGRRGVTPVSQICADVVRDSGWLARLESQGAAGQARAANVLAAVRYIADLTESLGLGPARAATEFDRWLASSKVAPASLAGDEGAGRPGTVQIMTVHASKGLEFPVVAVAECWKDGEARNTVGFSTPGVEGRCSFVLPPADKPKLDALDPEDLEPSADKSVRLPLCAQYRLARDVDKAGDAEERSRLLYVALTRAREALVVSVPLSSTKDGVAKPALAVGALRALGIEGVVPGESSVDYGGSKPARVRCVSVAATKATDVAGASSSADVVDAAGSLAGFSVDEPLLDPAAIVRVGTASSVVTCEGAELFDLYEMEPAPTAVVGGWRAREGVFSYSSVHASLAAEGGLGEAAAGHGPSRQALPTREEREAEAEGAPVVADEDRATNLGSAFHELAQAMVESGRAVTDERLSAMARRWNLSARGETRLRSALVRWEGSDVRAEALSHGVLRAEAPFFQRVDSVHGDYLEGAIDLLATDEGSAEALVVDYKTGDAGLSVDEVRVRHAMQAQFYADVLLREGFTHVTCAFVCVEREDPTDASQPLTVCYEFGK